METTTPTTVVEATEMVVATQSQALARSDAFQSIPAFEAAQRIASALAKSTVIPKDYQNNVPNVLVALNMANRVGADPIAVMQNLNIIHGRPSWSSAFCIGVLQSCGRFGPIKFAMHGEGDAARCRLETTDAVTGEPIFGPVVSIAMAKAEGWYSKSGSKWQTMPDLMLRYRAAAFFSRTYAADLLLGMQTIEESQDIAEKRGVSAKAEELEKLLAQ